MPEENLQDHLRAVLAVARDLEENFCLSYGTKSIRDFSGGDKQADILDAAEKFLKSESH